MIKRNVQILGEKSTLELLKANDKPLIPSIRVNTLKITKEALKTKLALVYKR